MSIRARYLPAVVVGLHLLTVSATAAQQRTPDPAPPRSTARLLAGGVLGGAVGVAVGGLTGAYIGANHCKDEGNPDSCHGIEGLLYGAAAGNTLSIPVGVHLANARAGRLAPSMLASALIAGAGVIAIVQTDNNAVMVGAALGVPALQLASSVIIERATARSRRR
jgi:hypothetical protein